MLTSHLFYCLTRHDMRKRICKKQNKNKTKTKKKKKKNTHNSEKADQPVHPHNPVRVQNLCCGYPLGASDCYDRALLPSIICLGRLRIASKYIFNLWQLRQGVDSLAQWLEIGFLTGRTGFDSHGRREIFSAMLHSFVTTIMSLDGSSSEIGLYTPKMASRHHKWWLPWRGGVLRPSTPTFDYLPWQITHSF